MSNALQPHGLQHTRLPCPPPIPRACSNSYPLSWWCHPTISSFVVSFSSCLQSFPASGSFQWVNSSHQVAKVLELQLQHQSFQWIFKTDFLNWPSFFKSWGFPCSSVGKESPCSVGDMGSIPGLEDTWRRKWQPTPVSLPGKSRGQRNLVGCGPWARKESGTT